MERKKLLRKAEPPSRRGIAWPRWTGFRGMTVRDWLELLIVPLALVVISFLFTAQQDQRQQEIENQRATAERRLAEQRAQDEILQAYFSQMSTLLLDKDLRASEVGSEVRMLARARTLSVLGSLDVSREATALDFLQEADLVQKVEARKPIISLEDADLRGAYLFQADLRGANLHFAELSSADLESASLNDANLTYAFMDGTDLSGADLSNANLFNAELSNANLRYAFMDGTDLSGADLSYADLSNAELSNADHLGLADLSEADLSGANLEGANVTEKQLAKCIGVDEVLERDVDVAALVHERYPEGIEALLDLVSYAPEGFDNHAEVLKDDGRGASSLSAAGEGSGRHNVGAVPSPENLERLGRLLEAGTLRVPIQKTYSLDQAGEALRALDAEHTQGKRAIQVVQQSGALTRRGGSGHDYGRTSQNSVQRKSNFAEGGKGSERSTQRDAPVRGSQGCAVALL